MLSSPEGICIMENKKPRSGIVFYCVILVLGLLVLYSGLRILESTVFYNGQEEDPTIHSRTIERDGVRYYPRQDITVVMLIGIDQFGEMVDSGSYNNAGAADMVTLIIFDEKNQETRLLCLNRDTMMDIPVLGIGGKPAGKVFAQLALSHTYGSGLEDSCENTRKAVSDFLYETTIDYYMAINMDAIMLFNDAVGGVTVTVRDDFSGIDDSLPMGEVTLMGKQAITFVRSRYGVGDQLNLSRMERQKEYMYGFIEALTAKKDDVSFALNTYDLVDPYMVTDCSATMLNTLLQRYADYPIVEVVTPEGENVMADYYQFHVDEEKLDDLILRLFYSTK